MEFFWTGSDPDGVVESFEWRISNNGADGIVDPPDTLASRLPWRRTTATDSVFVVTADLDSFRVDVGDTNQSLRNYRYWQTHTFFIRAVDDAGAHDPSPAMVSFTATTLAPTIKITVPAPRTQVTCIAAAKVLTFGWEAHDPDALAGKPEAVRYLLLPVRTGADDNCLIRSEFENADPPYIRADDPLWSRWIDFDAPADSGTMVTLPRHAAGSRFLFAVQARDVAGAVTPTFEWGRNVRHVETTNGKFPLLKVCDPYLGCDTFAGANGLKSFQIVSGQPIEFNWSGDAEEYAGIIDAYRFGWNVADPNDPNDPGWQVAWGNGPAWRRSPVRAFTQGSPNFVVRVRDNSGTISGAVYQFQVIQIPLRANQRNLLFVDDWPGSRPAAVELEWKSQWDAILQGSVLNFQRNDEIDTETDPNRLGFALASEYKAIIWFTGPTKLSYFHTRLAPIKTTEPRYNWLEIYQARVGNLLCVGPGAAYNSFERDPPVWLFPVIFDVPAGSNLGFGKDVRADGSEYNRGTIRWPYSAWCLESVDIVRPSVNQIYGETSQSPQRTGECDQLVRAVVATEFLQAYPDAEGSVRDLLPTRDRKNRTFPYHKPDTEEFYDVNTTKRQVSLSLRPCQLPMYRHLARRDAGLVSNPRQVCAPTGRDRSPLDGVPVAIASTRYTDIKQLRGSEDFLWGFHPLAFELPEVRDAILWILEHRWQLPVQR